MQHRPDHTRVSQKLTAAHVRASGAVAIAGRPSGIGDRAIRFLGI
jgi:hypothetical protein